MSDAGRSAAFRRASGRALIAVLAERINVDDRDSEALKTLTGIAMWLALARQNRWAIGCADRILEHPDQFSHSLSCAVLDAVQYVALNRLETERAEWSTRAIAWPSRALDAAARGLKAVRDSRGGWLHAPATKSLNAVSLARDIERLTPSVCARNGTSFG